MEQQSTSPAMAALKSGVIIGLVMLVISFLIYFIDYSLLVAAWYGFAVFVLFFGLVIYFGIQYRKEIGGFMPYGPAFQFAFVTLIVSGLISTLGNIILYQLIDPGLSELLVKVQLENMLAFAGQIKGFGVSLIIYAIFSLILGAIIKKRDKSTDF